ncbi:6-hydroxy-D-nicotine oxidase [Purpureocillium lavendulum]|uniref:6-hydroxy-D-nicotine oxidase n=1 Tax=Purpureocillium lavendulum TaxID=1247861 RepID=A0AB34FKP2_9HYPO|nr:6-hydroxy-D-nicotine oxidase [Purpureocillium lavendulum]
MAVRSLANSGLVEFAVRSGGHSHWAGGSSIQGGVTIDLIHFNTVSYDPSAQVASLGPSLRWGDVYEALESKGVMVAGGRDGNVGVAGLLTGGGNSYYTGRQGFACDNLVNAEVVLASGVVVEANASCNPDLWKALKGGLGNFGIVTRFDVRAFAAPQLWGGLRASDASYTDAVVASLVEFTDNNHKHQGAAFIINFTYQPALSSDILVAQVLVDTDGSPNASVFDEIQQVPAVLSDLKTRPMSGIAIDYILPSGLRNVWFTLTFKNDGRVVKKAAEMHKLLVKDLLLTFPVGDLALQSLFQPIPKLFADIGVAKGGNMLGLDQVEGNSLLWLCAASCRTVEQETVLHRRVKAMTSELKRFAESISALVPWLYVNYADPTQDALESYGDESVEFMWHVARKYDPTGVFQRLVPGSFKLPKEKGH